MRPIDPLISELRPKKDSVVLGSDCAEERTGPDHGERNIWPETKWGEAPCFEIRVVHVLDREAKSFAYRKDLSPV